MQMVLGAGPRCDAERLQIAPFKEGPRRRVHYEWIRPDPARACVCETLQTSVAVSPECCMWPKEPHADTTLQPLSDAVQSMPTRVCSNLWKICHQQSMEGRFNCHQASEQVTELHSDRWTPRRPAVFCVTLAGKAETHHGHVHIFHQRAAVAELAQVPQKKEEERFSNQAKQT